MAGINKVFLMGNLTRDPEVRYLQSGTAVSDFDIAVNRKYRDRSGEMKEETLFIRIVAWERNAEFCGEYLKKGRRILVEGRLRLDQWEGKDGTKRSRMEVVAERFYFVDSKAQSEEGESEVVGNVNDTHSSNEEATSQDSTKDDLPF